MKKLFALSALVALCLTAVAQTNTVPVSTNSLPPLPGLAAGLEQILGVFGGQAPTNITAGPFATANTKGKDWGYGITVAYNLINNVAFGLTVDSIPNTFTLFSGQVTLQLPVYPFGWTHNQSLTNWFVVPFVFSQLGSALGNVSQGNTGSGVILVTGTGINIPIITVLGGQFSLAGWYENLTGAGQYSGNRLGICPNWHKSF